MRRGKQYLAVMIAGRFFTDFAGDPDWNMAVDEWMLAQVMRHGGGIPPEEWGTQRKKPHPRGVGHPEEVPGGVGHRTVEEREAKTGNPPEGCGTGKETGRWGTEVGAGGRGTGRRTHPEGGAPSNEKSTGWPLWVRLYTWRPGAITFGRNQREQSALDWSRVGDTTVIRRVTGGRALYHDSSELTYAIAANLEALEGTPLIGSIARTGQVISEALVEFLRRRGLESQYMRHSSSENSTPEFFHKAPCFASHARHEIKSAVGKVVASAQRRIGPMLLQHGAIKVSGVVRHPALSGVGGCEEAERQAVTESILDADGARLEEVLERVLGVDFCREELSGAERTAVSGRREIVRKNRLISREILNSCPV